MFSKIKKFINQQTLLGEVLRFLLVGGGATIIDFLTMGIVLYAFAPTKYDSFFQVFIGSKVVPEKVATLLGTGLGFVVGLIFNYILSVIFVFNQNTQAKTFKGFVVFAVLSAIGLLLHEAGMWGLHIKLAVNEWIVKIIMTAVVLVYNFITRRLLIFNRKGEQKNEGQHGDTLL